MDTGTIRNISVVKILAGLCTLFLALHIRFQFSYDAPITGIWSGIVLTIVGIVENRLIKNNMIHLPTYLRIISGLSLVVSMAGIIIAVIQVIGHDLISIKYTHGHFKWIQHQHTCLRYDVDACTTFLLEIVLLLLLLLNFILSISVIRMSKGASASAGDDDISNPNIVAPEHVQPDVVYGNQLQQVQFRYPPPYSQKQTNGTYLPKTQIVQDLYPPQQPMAQGPFQPEPPMVQDACPQQLLVIHHPQLPMAQGHFLSQTQTGDDAYPEQQITHPSIVLPNDPPPPYTERS